MAAAAKAKGAWIASIKGHCITTAWGTTYTAEGGRIPVIRAMLRAGRDIDRQALAERFGVSAVSIGKDVRKVEAELAAAARPRRPRAPRPSTRPAMPPIPELPVRMWSGWYPTTWAADRRRVLQEWLAAGVPIDRKAVGAAWKVSPAMIGVDIKAAREALADSEDRFSRARATAAAAGRLAPCDEQTEALGELFGIDLARAA